MALPHKLVPVLSVVAALLVFAGFWMLGDELDSQATEHSAWIVAVAGSVLGAGGIVLGDRRLKGSPPNWPLYLNCVAALSGLLVVLITFAPQ